MFEKIFEKNKSINIEGNKEMLSKKAEKFLLGEKEKKEFARKKFEKYEQKRKELEQMPSSNEFRKKLSKKANPGESFINVPLSEIDETKEGLNRDKDIEIIEAMLTLKDWQDRFFRIKKGEEDADMAEKYKNKDRVELYYIYDKRGVKPEKKFLASIVGSFNKEEDNKRDEILKELGVDISHNKQIRILNGMKSGKENVFATDFSGMEVIFSSQEHIFDELMRPVEKEMPGQKVSKNTVKEISVRFYDPEERAREIK